MIKFPLTYSLFFAAGIITLLSSCDKQSPQEKQNASAATKVADDARYGPWSSKAELQFAMERLPADEFFSAVQGRCQDGINQYRAIKEKFQQEKYREWAGRSS